MNDHTEKMKRCHDYVEALEKEVGKIRVFERELPLSLELVTQALEACKRELSAATTESKPNQSEGSEQTTSSSGPVLEEFMPIKRASSSSSDNDDREQSRNEDKNRTSDKKKLDWLRSVQLWNQSPDPSSKEDEEKRASAVEVKSNGCAFLPFLGEKNQGKSIQSTVKAPSSVSTTATSSTTETVSATSSGSGAKREDGEGNAHRKQRRCWSSELHRRFLHALQKLGGSQVATPKQIRELMKVDGLTNDEVKSHLQKYRLHTRRPSPAVHNDSNPQPPQFVVVGSIWVPPPQYAATSAPREAETVPASNRIYEPVAAPPAKGSRMPASLMPQPQ
ncbi:Myb-like transcription factor family protein putative isoform 1 [Tripterygium wilfordii]|uniref:Myb-like transcription factor family protein putative isoform 1 n=1 Tax=Tripterygium wilfordii TaxID=458696 RepID=A0A7J7DG83_TRIWF|nr:transcription factor HHO3-like [Tripterygium wilfordii]KAF5745289.1 Myb-like transcription factor family protein putative isoform 1 [Tripterygium wilfordii]